MPTQTKTQRSAAARKAAATRKRNAARTSEAEATRLGAVGRQVERALLIPVGATLAAREAIADAFGTRTKLARQLDRFERRGSTALRRNSRRVEREAKGVQRDVKRTARTARRDVKRQGRSAQRDAEQFVDAVQHRLAAVR